jgi:CRISPR type II-A-associated protein Csn2
MILSHARWEEPLIYDESALSLLVIPDIKDYYRYSWELFRQVSGEEGGFSIQYKNMTLKLDSEVELITDFVSFSLNTRKTITHLQKKLDKAFGSSDLVVELDDMNERLINVLVSLRKQEFVDFSFDTDLGFSDYLKFLRVRYKDDFMNVEDLMSKYIDILAEMKKIKYMIYLSPSTIMDALIMIRLKDYALQHEIGSLFIERSVTDELRSDNHTRHIIL